MSEVDGVFRIENDEVEFTLFTGVLRTFDEAEAFCEILGRGSSLARIGNRAEFDLVAAVIEESQTIERIWIGKISNPNSSLTLLLSRITRRRDERKCSQLFFHRWRK